MLTTTTNNNNNISSLSTIPDGTSVTNNNTLRNAPSIVEAEPSHCLVSIQGIESENYNNGNLASAEVTSVLPSATTSAVSNSQDALLYLNLLLSGVIVAQLNDKFLAPEAQDPISTCNDLVMTQESSKQPPNSANKFNPINAILD
ncbi:hypothetical protein ACA910_011933 [Epithemia clementina (nom. ined.)]